jgi:hypothetical protein
MATIPSILEKIGKNHGFYFTWSNLRGAGISEVKLIQHNI